MLEFARSLSADSFVRVLIDSDARTRFLKGHSRPINFEQERMEMLMALRSVDDVKIFHSDQELIDQIKKFEPAIMVKGSDYRNKTIIGQEYCKEIIFYERIEHYSTTQKIQRIASR